MRTFCLTYISFYICLTALMNVPILNLQAISCPKLISTIGNCQVYEQDIKTLTGKQWLTDKVTFIFYLWFLDNPLSTSIVNNYADYRLLFIPGNGQSEQNQTKLCVLHHLFLLH